MKVSIVIPIYNVEKFLTECISSVVDQNYNDLEIILVNDGSTDNSGTICDHYAEKDSRIIVLHQKNKGVSFARNSGIDMATGQYICFVDADDWLALDFIDYMLKIITKTKTNMAVSYNCFKSNKKKQVKKDRIIALSSDRIIESFLSMHIQVGSWNKIYDLDFLKKNDLKFSTNFFSGEGLHFIVKAAKKANKIGVGYKSVYHYRDDNSDSVSKRRDMPFMINSVNSLEGIRQELLNYSRRTRISVDYYNLLISRMIVENLANSKLIKENIAFYNEHYLFIKRKAFYLSIFSKANITNRVVMLTAAIAPDLASKTSKFLIKLGSLVKFRIGC